MGTLRFLLALCVVVTHSAGSKIFGQSLLSGVTAVQGFYIVSGFLITMVLNTRAEYRSIFSFYISRYLRLWPAYAVVAILVLALLKHETWFAAIAKLDYTAALIVIASNCIIFFQDLALFFAIGPDGALYPTSHFGSEPGTPLYTLLLIPQAWSLGIELTFYLIAPFVCRSPLRLLTLFALAMVTRLAIGQWSPPGIDPWHYRFSPAEMTMFASGGMAYFAGRGIGRIVSANAMQTIGTICLAALTVVILATPADMQSFSPVLFLQNTTILAMIAVSCPFLLSVSRAWKLDAMIGELSYPMYLSHLFVNETMYKYAPSLMTESNFAYVCATIAFSIALLWLVVLPVDRYRRRFGARMPDGSGVIRIGSDSVGGTGIIGKVSG